MYIGSPAYGFSIRLISPLADYVKGLGHFMGEVKNSFPSFVEMLISFNICSLITCVPTYEES